MLFPREWFWWELNAVSQVNGSGDLARHGQPSGPLPQFDTLFRRGPRRDIVSYLYVTDSSAKPATYNHKPFLCRGLNESRLNVVPTDNVMPKRAPHWPSIPRSVIPGMPRISAQFPVTECRPVGIWRFIISGKWKSNGSYQIAISFNIMIVSDIRGGS